MCISSVHDSVIRAIALTTLLYLEVPYEPLLRGAPESRELAPHKRHWHEHINFFSPESLICLLAGLGLRCMEQHVLRQGNKNNLTLIARRI